MLSLVAVLSTILLPAQDPFSVPGSFAWGERTVPLTRSDASTFNAKVYYPSTIQGLNTPIDTSAGPYPAITFAHGFGATADFYDSTLRHLATRGFVVIATQSQAGFNPNRTQYIQDVKDTLTYLETRTVDSNSFLFGQVDTTKLGTSGHSLGGAMSVIVGAQDPRVKAIANVAIAAGGAPGTTDNSTLTAISSLNVPVNFIYGDQDGTTPLLSNGVPAYNAAQGPKILPVLAGGYHCGFIDFVLPPPFCDDGDATQADNLAFSRAELTAFFELYFKDNQDAWRRVWGPDRLGLPGITTQLDPGFSLTPSAASQLGSPTDTVVFDILLRNTSDQSDSFDLFAEDNLFGITFSTDTTPILAPGDEFLVQAFVNVPSAPSILSDTALISARSNRDNGTRAFTYITTAVPEIGSLPIVASLSILFLGLARKRNTAVSRA